MKSEKKKRPPQTGEPVLVRLQPNRVDAVDDWRRKQSDMPTRAEAIRRLVDLGLQSPPAGGKGRK